MWPGRVADPSPTSSAEA